MKKSKLATIERTVVGCTRCPDLRAYIAGVAVEKKRAFRECAYWGKPVPGFGDRNAALLIVGLAPGAHGSNRTGRPFTGDASGDFLYPALYRAGFASQPNATDRNDGLELLDAYITAAVRCAPPKNKPSPVHLRNCLPYLLEEFEALDRMRVVVALGGFAFTAVLRGFTELGYALEPFKPKFGHGAHAVATRGGRRIEILASYHPSRQNTNTGVLTARAFDAVFGQARAFLDSAAARLGSK